MNYVWYASGNEAAKSDIDPEILEHPGIYPTAEAQKNLFVVPVYDARLDRTVTRLVALLLGKLSRTAVQTCLPPVHRAGGRVSSPRASIGRKPMAPFIR